MLLSLAAGCAPRAGSGRAPRADRPPSPRLLRQAPPLISEAAGLRQPPAAPHSAVTISALDLARVLEIARANNPTFEQFAVNRAAAHARLNAAQAWPALESEYASRSGSDIAPAWDQNFEFSRRQPIELPAKRRSRLAAIAAGQAVAASEEEAFQSTLRADVAVACNRVIFWREAADLARRWLEQDEQTPARPPAELDHARDQVQEAERFLNTARESLDTLTGGALPNPYVLTDSLPGELPAVDPESAVREALAAHPRLRRLEALAARERADSRSERAESYPDVVPGFYADSEDDGASPRQNYALSLGLEIPLSGRERKESAAATAEFERLQAERERARREVEAEVRQALADYADARNRLAALGPDRAGIEDQIAPSDQTTLADTRQAALDRLNARYEAALARIALDRAIGRETPAAG